jgi:hypothetical protein
MFGEREHTPSRGALYQYLANEVGSPHLLPIREAKMCPPASYYELLQGNSQTYEWLQ